MAKPIFVVKVDTRIPIDKIDDIAKRIESILCSEYHVLIVQAHGYDDPQFICFNVDKMPESEISEIKEMIKQL